jgi:hypothetical protein
MTWERRRMTAPLPEPTLAPQDLYVLVRALVGQDWQTYVCSPPVRLLLTHATTNPPDGLNALRLLLGTKTLKHIVTVCKYSEPFGQKQLKNKRDFWHELDSLSGHL